MTRAKTRRTTVKVLGVLTLAIAGLLAFELTCQIYARTVIFRDFDRTRADPRHYYQTSPSPQLAYELRPNSELSNDHGVLRINRWGIRESSDEVDASVRRVAVLGDSVVFGVGHDQARTLSARVERKLDPRGGNVRVYNFGLGGLNMLEIGEYLRIKNEIYDVSDVVYLVNPNDYAPRNTVYEGADNALFRIHERPILMGPWFVRKAIYRVNKGGPSLVQWYEWMFKGNERWGQEALRRMKSYTSDRGIAFSVVLLPSIHAFSEDGSYAVAEINDRVGAFLESEGIVHLDARWSFADEPAKYLDPTDHLHSEGAGRMAEVLTRALVLADPELARIAVREPSNPENGSR